MNKINLLLMGALAICAGCATKEMKSTPFYTGNQVTYTGRVEDRVNLWPAAYYREPVGSVAWPLLSFSNDHFALRPLYSQYKQDGVTGRYDEFNVLWPICQFDTKHDDYRVFPFCWGTDYFTLFPLLWYRPNDYFVLFPEIWWCEEMAVILPFWKERNGSGMGVFPLFVWDQTASSTFNTLFPLWWYSSHGSEDASKRDTFFWAAAGMAGFEKLAGAYQDSWLFPLYYHSEDSLVTPLFGWDSHSKWMLPLFYRDRDSFCSLFYISELGKAERTWCVPPLLTFGTVNDKTGAESVEALLGLGGYTKEKDEVTASWVLPLFFQNHDVFLTALFGKTATSDWVIPLYYRNQDLFLSSLYGRTKTSDWLIPFYYRNEHALVTPLFGMVDDSNWFFPVYYHDADKFVTPLYGKSGDADWLLPLYYRDRRSFYSLLYAKESDAEDRASAWCVPPLLSFGSYDRQTGAENVKVLAGLGGYAKDAKGGTAVWTFPLFYRDDDTFVSPLYGKDKDVEWLFPLCYYDKDDFVSLLYIRDVDEKSGATTHVVPPLLSVCARNSKTGTESNILLMGLVGNEKQVQGEGGKLEWTKDWLLPLYAHAKDEWFLSLAAGYTGGGTSQTNTWWCTPLVGTKSGRKDGFWLFPLLDHEAVDSSLGDYSKLAALTRAEALPPEIVFEQKTVKQTQWEPARTSDGRSISKPVEVSKTVLSTPDRRASEETTLLLLNKHRKSVNARMGYDNKNYRVSASRESGNALLMKHSRETTACFDPQTRKRKSVSKSRELNVLYDLFAHWKSRSDTADHSRSWDLSLLTVLFNGDGKTYQDGKSRGSANVLGLLYNSEWELDGDEESSILWRVWHRERKNGQVTVDMFPGITYDAKKDGYCQTSFLWRFFRYQNEPGKGVSFDLFFLPLARP